MLVRIGFAALAALSSGACAKSVAPPSAPFVQASADRRHPGARAMTPTTLGQPLFLSIALHGLAGTEFGIDGPTVGEAGYDLLISREIVHLPEKEPTAPGQSLTIVSVPDRSTLSAAVPVWFGEPGSDGVRRLVFPEPGRYIVRVRFYHVLRQAKYPYERPEWFTLTSQMDVIDVEKGDLAVAAFAEAMAPFVGPKTVVSAKGRPLLRDYVQKAEAPVKTWAQWLLLRSYASDADWWKSLKKGDAGAVEELSQFVPVARRFVDDNAYRGTPPRYDALIILAAKAAQDGDAETALKHLAEARRHYGGMMLPRDVIGLGEALPSTRPATQPATAAPQESAPVGSQVE